LAHAHETEQVPVRVGAVPLHKAVGSEADFEGVGAEPSLPRLLARKVCRLSKNAAILQVWGHVPRPSATGLVNAAWIPPLVGTSDVVHPVVVVVIHDDAEAKLLDVAESGRLFSGQLRLSEDREKDRGQDRDDGDDY
jgi:hypothetical protein